MRNISFSLTTPQIRARTKTVTRRLYWLNLAVGDRLQACEKCMGRRHGEPLVRLAVIEVVSVRRERLARMIDPQNRAYGFKEVIREGFPDLNPHAFVSMFCREMKCDLDVSVTRIEFKYVVDLADTGFDMKHIARVLDKVENLQSLARDLRSAIG